MLAIFSTSIRADDPPSFTRLFPPGGQLGTSVEVKFSGKPGDGTLQVHADESFTVTFNEKQDSAKIDIAETATPGLHWLRFFNEFGTTDPLPLVVGLIPEQQEAEPNNKLAEATALEPTTVTINGILDQKEDVDCFSLDLNKGQTVVAIVEANSVLGSPMDAVLQLTDQHGTVLNQNDDDHGFDPLLVFTAPTAGKYTLRLFAFPATPNSTIRLASSKDYVYRLTVSTKPLVHHTRPALRGTDTGEVELRGWNLPPDTTAAIDDSLTITASTSLPFALAEVPHKSLVEADSRALPVPASVTGCIETNGEVDEYTFTGKKGDQVTLSVTARSLHSLLDPVLTIRNADGKTIKTTDDRSKQDLDAEAAIKLPADGEYTAAISDRYQSSGPRHFYVFTVEPTTPSFSATVAATKFQLTRDKPLEIPVTVNRANGFSEPISVTADLPAGVTCEEVVSKNDDDTKKKVTLKITADKDAAEFSGAFQIQCRSGKDDVQTATAAIPKSVQTTDNLWLTIRPAKPK